MDESQYMEKARAGLKRIFGYPAFRQGQEQAIRRILFGGDLLAILPTGGGKSICYQLPAVVSAGLTLVISPLISLMKDQVDQLRQLNIAAEAINSSVDALGAHAIMDMARGGQLKLLYLAPERLDYESCRSDLWSCDVRRVIIDKAHCVSQWGHDFRPSYLAIRQFVEGFAHRPVIAAFTATATDRVSRDIVEQLGLIRPEILKTGYDRPNLAFSVINIKKSLRSAYIRTFVKAHAGKSGIVYCSSRKDAEKLAAELGALCYHAGMDDAARRRAQDAFINDANYIMCATNAFGMGIDKPDVRFVIHYHMPASIEAYWQEAGRAGRDGMGAECILLADGGDAAFWAHMISAGEGGAAEKAKRRQRLKSMAMYAHAQGCLRQYLVGYFGEHVAACGICSNCLAEADAGEYADITREAQMILSAVKRCGERVGKALIAGVLKGSRGRHIAALGLDRQSTYGLMRDKDVADIKNYIDALTAQNMLTLSDGRYPTLKLTEYGMDVLRGKTQVRMKAPSGDEYSRALIAPHKAASQNGQREDSLYGDALFERLRNLRKRIADEQGIPVFMVFGDAALADMTRRRPHSRTEFRNVSSVGEYRLARYGDRFIAEINDFCDLNESRPALNAAGGISRQAFDLQEGAYNVPAIEAAPAVCESGHMRRMTSDLILFLKTYSAEFLSEFPEYGSKDIEALIAYIRERAD